MIDMYNMEDGREGKHCCPMMNYGMMCPKMMEANWNMHHMTAYPPCMSSMNNQWHYNNFNPNMGYMNQYSNMNINPMMLRTDQQYSGYPYTNMTPVSIEELQD